MVGVSHMLKSATYAIFALVIDYETEGSRAKMPSNSTQRRGCKLTLLRCTSNLAWKQVNSTQARIADPPTARVLWPLTVEVSPTPVDRMVFYKEMLANECEKIDNLRFFDHDGGDGG